MQGETQPIEAQKTELLNKEAQDRVSKDALESGYESKKEFLEAGDFESEEQYLAMEKSLREAEEAIAKTDLLALAEAKTEVFRAIGEDDETIQMRIKEEFGDALEEAKKQQEAKIAPEDAVTEKMSLRSESQEDAVTEKVGLEARTLEDVPTETLNLDSMQTEELLSTEEFASDVFTPEQQREVIEREGGEVPDLEGLQLAKLEKVMRLEKKLESADEEDKTALTLRLQKAQGELNRFAEAYPDQAKSLELQRTLIDGHEDQLRLNLLVNADAESLSKELTEDLLNGETTKELAAGTPENTAQSRYFLTMVELGNQRGVAESLAEQADLRIEALRDPNSDQLPEAMKNDEAILAMSAEERKAQIQNEMKIADAYEDIAQKFENKRLELKTYLEDNFDMKQTPKDSELTTDSLLERVRASAEKNASAEEDEDVAAIRRSAVSQKLNAIKSRNAENAAQRRKENLEKWEEDPEAAEAAFQRREKLYDAIEKYQDEQYEKRKQVLDDYYARVDAYKQERLNREVEAERAVANQRAEDREQSPAQDLIDQMQESELELARKEKAELPENPNSGAGVEALMSRLQERAPQVRQREGGPVAPETPAEARARKNKDAKEAGFMSEPFAQQMDKILMGYLLAKDELANGKRSDTGEVLSEADIKEREALLEEAEQDYADMFGEDGVEMLREGNERAKEVGPSEAAEELLARIQASADRRKNGGSDSIAAK